ncbi:MAG: hypothetical protein V4577_31460 [Bacteroidota bacterium]
MKNISSHEANQHKIPSSLDISVIIILGIAGMMGTFQYLLSDLKINGYKKESWTVRDSTGRTGKEKNVLIDTLTIVYHPQIATHHADSKVSAVSDKKTKTPATGVGKAFDFESIYFAYNSVILVWFAIFSVMLGCSLALLPVIISAINNIVREFKLPRRRQLLAFLLAILVGILIFYAQHINYLLKPTQVLAKLGIVLGHPDYLYIFIITSISVALIAIAGQLMINQAISTLPNTILGLDVAAHNKIAAKFELLRNQLGFFLLIDSVLIVLSVLNTDTYRRAIISEVSVNMDIVPRNYGYIYGLLFTFLLAVIYMPIYYRLKRKGEMMLKEIPRGELDGGGQDIAAVLNIKQTPIESFKVALSILAPVLTSLVPGLLNI